MKKVTSRLLTIILIAVFVLGMSSAAFAASHIKINGVDMGYAAGEYFSKNKGPCTCHNKGMCVPEKSGCNCKHVNGTAQCYAFALWCENKMYGCNDKSKSGNFKNIGSVDAGKLNAGTLKALISKAPIGSHIRTGTKNPHSMILMSKDSKGFTVAQANGSNNKGLAGRHAESEQHPIPGLPI